MHPDTPHAPPKLMQVPNDEASVPHAASSAPQLLSTRALMAVVFSVHPSALVLFLFPETRGLWGEEKGKDTIGSLYQWCCFGIGVALDIHWRKRKTTDISDNQ